MKPSDNEDAIGRFLELECVHACYDKKEILHGVSLTINRGEIVALLGGNGSGKSTTLKTIAGLLHPTSGKVWLNGIDISKEATHARQAMGVGYLMQGGRIFPNLTVGENFLIAESHKSKRQLAARGTLGAIFPDLEDRAHDRAGLLSGGQRQMLAIEMVLAQNPALLLLDEPTGALATGLVRSILETLLKLCHERHFGVLLVEQNVEEAKRISARTYMLADGVTLDGALAKHDVAALAVGSKQPEIAHNN